jgi:hypothetical protein
MCVVLAHPRVVFHPYICGLRRGATVVAAAPIDYNDVEVAAGTTTQRRRSWMTTSSTPTRDYVGSLLQLFFRYSVHLVVMTIYDPFTYKFSGCNGRCNASVAYLSPYTSILHSPFHRFAHRRWPPSKGRLGGGQEGGGEGGTWDKGKK